MPERYLGRTLGKYRVDELLGSGGFAWVYRGHDPELGIPVALKVLKPQFAGDPDFEARFRSEASTAARLRHPNIVTIYAVGRDGDAVHFAMDYLPQSLTGRLQVLGTLPAALLVRLGVDVARALAYAHREGVVHRDIKTDNILFDDHGNAIVADFGIARAVAQHAEHTGTNLVVGTPQYFAPEQARGRPVDGRTDIYSLGVTLYHAATGQLPFTGADWYEVARKHVEEEPPAPRTLAPTLPHGLEAIILRCLEKDPEDRYQTADELAEALLRETPDLGPDSGARTLALPGVDRLLASRVPSRRRRRLRRLLAGTVGLLAVTGVGAAVWYARDDAAPRDAEAAARDTARSGAVVGARPTSPGGGADSATGDSAPDTSARPAPAPTTAALRIVTPPGVTLLVDGRPEQRRSLELAPGRHVLSASVRSLPGCPSSTVADTLSLVAGRAQTAELSPRPCGLVTIEIEGAESAHYRLTPRDGGQPIEGRLPMEIARPVPVGEYDLKVHMAPRCAEYNSSRPLVVEAGVEARREVSLICSPVGGRSASD